MKTHESEEMYLETIYLLREKQASIHAIDIAGELGYAKSSVSRAVGLLHKKGYIDINEYDEITLTKTGFAKAAHIYERHRVISELLIRMGADEVLAEENACRIEHVITPELFGIIKEYLKK
ncbi:MAG: metal-dependent transcriptional regulator [Clostridia bacterium]|nr:metal-dependent transcriptional regulator [Clostridia bacterium]